MNFLPDVYVPCEVCHGKRYNRETLEVTYHGKSISDVLDMTVTEALSFFQNIPRSAASSRRSSMWAWATCTWDSRQRRLSGGEAQRVKLAKELQRVQTGRTFYILDEPTTGLHFEDVRQLIQVLERLVDAGNTVLVIEHNLDVIKMADRLIDMGPEGGDGGGTIVAYGTPEEVAKVKESYTGRYLAPILARDRARMEKEDAADVEA
jgi:excinuclease ABC subunit A